MAKQIHQLAGLTGNIASSDVFAVDTGTVTRKYPYGTLAGAVVEQYNGSTIGGKAQTIKAAIDALAGVLSDAEIRKIFTGNTIVAPASGAGEIGGLMIYGKSVQDSTPSPSSPAAITTAGSGESIGIVSVNTGTDNHNATTDSTKYMDASGNISDDNRYILTDFIPISGNYLYIKWDNVVGTGCYLRPAYYTADKTFSRRDAIQMTQGQPGTFWTPIATAKYVRLCIDNTSANRVSGLTVHDGYGSNLTTPNGLPGIPVASGGNYTDTNGQMWICDTIDLEAGVYTKRVETYTVTGSESISKSSESAMDTYLLYFPTGTPDLVKGNTAFLCSHFMASGTTAVGNAEIPTTGNYLRMRCHYASAGTSTVEAFTAAITGMTVVYALATPEVSQLTQAQITALKALKSFDGGTALFTTDDVQPDLRAKIFVNAGAYI